MSVRLGINPIAWTNDCLPWLGDLIPLAQCLAEARQAGFSGVELGRKFPRRAAELRPLLEAHGLALVSGWYSATLLSRDAREEIAALEGHLELLAALGAPVLVFAETTGETINQAGAPASSRPRLGSAAEWRRLGERVTAVADHALGRGVRLAVHPHVGTVVETGEDVDRLLESCGPSVGLLLDTGHLTYAGSDPLAVARRHTARIAHVHCKDVRRYALAACRRRDASFSSAVLQGIFTAPGDGIVDFAGLFAILAEAGYRGWLVQEAEQDPRFAHPLCYAELGCAHLRELCRGAGLGIAP
jgi:inosose dehydratase